MDLPSARAILGVSATDDWIAVRAAYRARIRLAHPDIAGAEGTERSVELNAAYRTLAHARREGRLHDAPPSSSPAPAPSAAPAPEPAGGAPRATRPEWSAPIGPATDVRVLGADTIALSSTPDETFRRLVEAAHEIGEISYLDRSSGIFETVLALDDGTPASFVVTLQWRAHDATCEAFFTMDALGRPEQLDVSGVVHQLLRYIGPDRMA